MNVRYWHKADIPGPAVDVRYWGQSGHRTDLSSCLLLTQSKHTNVNLLTLGIADGLREGDELVDGKLHGFAVSGAVPTNWPVCIRMSIAQLFLMGTTGLSLHPTILGCFAGSNFFHRLSESVDLEFLAGIA
ncbi:MAG: hypothetical protein WA214_03990, partial [Pseudolabrys sp.]